jgi:hypothetical protein
VAGTSGSFIGVQGYSTATDQPASLGWTAGNSTGVQGASGGSLPAAKANRARLFLKDNGLGKAQLCVKFANGPVKVLATEG